jgi:hypothetical protein
LNHRKEEQAREQNGNVEGREEDLSDVDGGIDLGLGTMDDEGSDEAD